jgi:sugar lactone lactonase YvrE
MSNCIDANLLHELSVGNQLGEGVQWHQETQAVWWTDIEGCCLFSYSLITTEITKHPMPERVGCFSFIEHDQRLLIAFASGVALFDLETNNIEWLAQPELTIQGNRFNDGRVDRQGRFWAGTMVEHKHSPKQSASLYCQSSKNSCIKSLENIQISNGLCWSPDGTVMYHADSPTQTIYQYEFDLISGKPHDKRLFMKLDGGCFPDGSCIDSNGFLWNAQWGGAQVVRYSPDGKVDFVLPVPTKQPSCVAIGGPEMDLLFITSAKQDLSEQELKNDKQAGNLFIYQLSGVKGIVEPKVSW